jgi:hypothetical protein
VPSRAGRKGVCSEVCSYAHGTSWPYLHTAGQAYSAIAVRDCEMKTEGALARLNEADIGG